MDRGRRIASKKTGDKIFIMSGFSGLHQTDPSLRKVTILNFFIKADDEKDYILIRPFDHRCV